MRSGALKQSHGNAVGSSTEYDGELVELKTAGAGFEGGTFDIKLHGDEDRPDHATIKITAGRRVWRFAIHGVSTGPSDGAYLELESRKGPFPYEREEL